MTRELPRRRDPCRPARLALFMRREMLQHLVDRSAEPGSQRIIFHRRGGFAHTCPAPASPTVIKGLVFLLVTSAAHGGDSDVSTVVYSLRTFRLQCVVNRIQNSFCHKGSVVL